MCHASQLTAPGTDAPMTAASLRHPVGHHGSRRAFVPGSRDPRTWSAALAQVEDPNEIGIHR